MVISPTSAAMAAVSSWVSGAVAPVDGGLADAGAVGDVVDAQRLDAALDDQRKRRFEDGGIDTGIARPALARVARSCRSSGSPYHIFGTRILVSMLSSIRYGTNRSLSRRRTACRSTRSRRAPSRSRRAGAKAAATVRERLLRSLLDREWTEPLPIFAFVIEHPEGRDRRRHRRDRTCRRAGLLRSLAPAVAVRRP